MYFALIYLERRKKFSIIIPIFRPSDINFKIGTGSLSLSTLFTYKLAKTTI